MNKGEWKLMWNLIKGRIGGRAIKLLLAIVCIALCCGMAWWFFTNQFTHSKDKPTDGVGKYVYLSYFWGSILHVNKECPAIPSKAIGVTFVDTAALLADYIKDNGGYCRRCINDRAFSHLKTIIERNDESIWNSLDEYRIRRIIKSSYGTDSFCDSTNFAFRGRGERGRIRRMELYEMFKEEGLTEETDYNTFMLSLRKRSDTENSDAIDSDYD